MPQFRMIVMNGAVGLFSFACEKGTCLDSLLRDRYLAFTPHILDERLL